MNRRLRHLLIGVVASVVALLPLQGASAADPSAEDTVTWTVRPSDGAEEDGRSWVELELAPGDVAHEHLLIRNLGPEPVSFRLVAADGYLTDTGRFNMLTAERPSSGAGTWIQLNEDIVEVPPGSPVVVPFTITVPEDASPGDHLAGVAATIRSGSEAQVGVESRVGFRVMTRVSGELDPAVAATVEGAFAGPVNPFSPGTLTIDYAVSNTGNARLSVSPTVTANALFGAISMSAAGEQIVEIAPGETRRGSVTFDVAWPLFAYSALLDADATVLTPLGAPTDAQAATANAAGVILAIPWSLMVAVAVTVLVVWWVRTDRRRRDQKIQALIESAREDERARLAGVATASHLRVPAALLAVALPLLWVHAPEAVHAAEPDSDSVSIFVEITPAPAPVVDVTDPAIGILPFTGPAGPTWLALAAAGAILLGVALTWRGACRGRDLRSAERT